MVKKGHIQTNDHNNNAQQAAKRMIGLMIALTIPQCTFELAQFSKLALNRHVHYIIEFLVKSGA